MSNITVEDLKKSANKIQDQFKDQTLIDWEDIQKSQKQLNTEIQITMDKFIQLREMISRQYLDNLRELKQLDAKDLVNKVAEGKADPKVLSDLIDYSAEENGDIVIDVPTLKEDTDAKIKKFSEMNSTTIKQFSALQKQIDEFAASNLPKQKEALDKALKEHADNIQKASQEQQSKQQQVVNYNFKFDDNRVNEIASKIKVEYIPSTDNLISIKTYAEIVDKSIDVAESEYVRLTNENRKSRREAQGEPTKYLKLMMDYLNDFENMLMKSQEVLCEKLGITQAKLEQSEYTLLERGLGNQLFMMQAGVRQKIKERLPKNNQIGANKTREVIEYQITTLNNKEELFLPVLKEMPKNQETQSLVPIILNLMIADIIFEEFKFEEEDYIHKLIDNSYFKEQEIMTMLQSIEAAIVKLLQKSGLEPQQQMPPMGAGGMPPMGGMGGMPPMF